MRKHNKATPTMPIYAAQDAADGKADQTIEQVRRALIDVEALALGARAAGVKPGLTATWHLVQSFLVTALI